MLEQGFKCISYQTTDLSDFVSKLLISSLFTMIHFKF